MPKKLVSLLILLSLPLIACAAEYPWKLKLDKEGVSVYTRKVEASPILEYKGIVVVDEPLAKVDRFFEDNTKMPIWFYQCVEAKLIQEESAEKKIYYIVVRLPWPVSERDCVYSGVKSVDSKSGVISYVGSALPKMLPEEKGRVRVLYLNSIWRFTPLKDGRTEIYFQQHSDPGGIVPTFLVNKLSVDIPFNSLKNLRKMVKEIKD